jgi:DNA end-binding protein Ku
MRSMWSGTITFGMVSIPVKLYKASDSTGSGLSMICTCHHEQISKPNRCRIDDKNIASSDMVHAVRRNDQWIVIDDFDLESLPLKTLHTIDIDRFVPRGEVAMRLYAHAIYWLEPNDPKKLGSDKPYAMLREALARSGTYGIGKIGMRDKEQLVALSNWGKAILMTALTWPELVRKYDDLKLPDQPATDAEIAVATQLVDTMRDKWDSTQYQDQYQPALQQLIESKAKGLALAKPAVKVAPPPDLMDQLRESMVQEKQKRGKRKAS